MNGFGSKQPNTLDFPHHPPVHAHTALHGSASARALSRQINHHLPTISLWLRSPDGQDGWSIGLPRKWLEICAFPCINSRKY